MIYNIAITNFLSNSLYLHISFKVIPLNNCTHLSTFAKRLKEFLKIIFRYLSVFPSHFS